MMKAAPVQVKIISIPEAWRRSQVAGGGSTSTPQPQQQPPTRISVIPTTTPSPAGLQIKGPPPVISSASFGGNGNPCLDLCFHSAVPKEEEGQVNFNELGCLSREYLDQLLPAAWSHGPLTTLKVIFNLGDRKDDDEAFYTAGYWLHQNHPKTLAANLPLIACSFSNGFELIAQMMHRIRLLQVSKGRQASPAAAADYLSLHDRISDRMARCFKSAIETLGDKQNRQNLSTNPDYCEELWFAEDYVIDLRNWQAEHPVLCKSIAKKLFPRESDPEYQDVDDDYYTYSVTKQLVDDIFEPLQRLVETSDRSGCEVVWYHEHDEEHWKQVLPEEAREILETATDSELGKPAELRLAIYLEEKQKQQGKLNNCLPVWVWDPRGTHRDMFEQASLTLTALVSQLAEEPWKGKVISLGTKNHPPRLLTIDDQGGHGDLISKRAFLKGLMDDPDLGSGMMIDFDFHKVFDLILQVAVDQNLKPGQMIKRVFVFTTAASFDFKWEIHDYEAIKSRFKDKGYEEDVVPRLVFWSLGECKYTTAARSTHKGLTILSGYDYSLLKSFLDNDGDIGLDHVMEAAISGEKYDDLVVVD